MLTTNNPLTERTAAIPPPAPRPFAEWEFARRAYAEGYDSGYLRATRLMIDPFPPVMPIPAGLSQLGVDAWLQGQTDGYTTVVTLRENLLRNSPEITPAYKVYDVPPLLPPNTNSAPS